MGYVDYDTSDNATLVQYYNIYHAVGKNCPNMSDDVKLVQYLLKIFYETFPVHLRPGGVMTVDGLCGPITNHWIYKFQWDANKQHPNEVALDNVVDPIRKNQGWKGSISNTYYTLYLLNYNAQKRDPKGFFQALFLVPMTGDLSQYSQMALSDGADFAAAKQQLITPRPFV